MAIKLSDVLLYLGATDEQLKADLKGAEKTTESWSKGVSGRLDDVFRGAFERVGHLATDLVATGARAAVGFVTDSISAASDLNESISKVNVVFGESADEIQAWSQNAASAFGQSRQQALEAVGTFGNLFDSMGLGKDVTADMSKGLVELASDLASFNNLDPTEALEKLRSGIVGETEPLRALGVNINAAAVEAKALQLGLVKMDVDMTKVNRATLSLEKANADAATALKKHGAESLQYREAQQKVAEAEKAVEQAMAGKKVELTAAQKAQAAYAIILDQTKNAQGDFARTADGAANSQRALSAQMADLKSTVGEALLPAWSELLTALNETLKGAMPQIATFVRGTLAPAILELIDAVKEWITWFMNLDPATQRLIGIIAGVVAGLVPLLAILGPVIAAVSGLIGIFSALAPVVGVVVTALGLLLSPIGLIVAAVAGLALAWSQNWFGIRDKTAEITSAIGSTLSGWMTSIGETIRGGLETAKGWWQTHDQDVQALAENHWAIMLGIFTTQWELLRGITTAGVQFLQGDWEGGTQTLKETLSGFWDNVKGIFADALDMIRNLFKLFGWGDIGEEIINGIANGIRGAAGFLRDAATAAAQSALDAAKGWLGISSPSRRAAAEIGEPFAQGIGEGASSKLGAVAQEIQVGLRGLIGNIEPPALDLGAPLAAAGAGAGTPGFVITINQTFTGPTDTEQARRGSEAGILAAMRQIGLR